LQGSATSEVLVSIILKSLASDISTASKGFEAPCAYRPAIDVPAELFD
jgi:hypothetical protein